MSTPTLTIDEFQVQLARYRLEAPRVPREAQRAAAGELLHHLREARRRNDVPLATAIDAAIDRYNQERSAIAIRTLHGDR